MLGVKLADLRGDSLMLKTNGHMRLKHMQEALQKQTKMLEIVAGSSSSSQEKMIENVRNYFTTSTNSDAVEALANLYPITMTAVADARMSFSQHCAMEKEVKSMQVKMFSTKNNLGLRLALGSSDFNVKNYKSKGSHKSNKSNKKKTSSRQTFGLWSFNGPTGASSPFDDDLRVWELQCVRQHEQVVQRASQGFFDKNYISDSGAKRARGFHISEFQKTMVCPLCVSLVQNELDDERESTLSMRGLQKGTMSSTYAFCQRQSDPYFKTTCHYIATGLEDIISGVLQAQAGTGDPIDDSQTLLLRTNPARLRLILDRLLSPNSKFANLGGGDAMLWRQAEGMDGGGNTSPKLLLAADVCHKFMACDSFAQESGSNSGGGGSRSEVNDAASGAASSDSGQSDLILDEAVKLLEKWDSQNDNAEALEGLTKNIVKLAETSHDRLLCDDFQRVQNEYGQLRKKSESTGNDKLCFACVKMATISIEHMLTTNVEDMVSL